MLLGRLPVCEGSDDKSWGATQVLVPVSELSVAYVGKAVLLHIVPPGHWAMLETSNIKSLLTCASVEIAS